MKRRLLLALVLVVVAAVAASFALLRSEWGATRLCRLAGAAVERGTGLPLVAASCRIDPVTLELEATGIRLGGPERPLFVAERLRVRVAALQALGGRLILSSVELTKPRVDVELHDGGEKKKPDACPPQFLSRIEVQNLAVDDAALELRLASGARLAVTRADLRTEPARLGSRSRFELRLDAARFVDGVRELAASGRATGEIAHDLSRLEIGAASVEGEAWSAAASGVVEELCRPRLRLDGAARAPLALLAALAGRPGADVAGTVEARFAAAGPVSSPAVNADLQLVGARLGQFLPGDARARVALRGRELRIDPLELAGEQGQATIRATVRLDREPRLEAEAELSRVELAEVLERTGLPGSWVLLRASGHVKLAGTLSPVALQGSGSLDVADFKVLTHSWRTLRAGEQPVLELAAGHVESALRIGADAVRLDGATLRVGRESLRADAELFLASRRGFAVKVHGNADLSALRHVAGVPIAGRAQLTGTVRAAPYGNPRIEGTLRADELHFLDLSLGEAGAQAAYGPGDDFVLHLEQVEGRKGETSYGGAVAVDLQRSPPEVVNADLRARGRLRDLFEAVMPWLPSTRVVRDHLDAAVEVEATASGPATALDADFRAKLGAGTVLGRAFDAGSVDGRVEGGERAIFRRVELRRAGGVVRTGGRWEFAAPHRWELDASWSSLPLGDALGSPDLWTGRAHGVARLRGSLEVPDVRWSSTAKGAAIAGVPLADLRAEGGIEGEALSLEATAAGVKLWATGKATGEGPFDARAEIEHDDVGQLFRPGEAQGARLRVRGVARAQGVLADVAAARAEVQLDRLDAAYSDFRVANDGPVDLAIASRRVEVRPFRMRGTNTALAVAGHVAPDGTLALDATGTLDLRILGDAVPRVTKPAGQLALEAHVAGTVVNPVLVGAGRLAGGGFQFKDVPVAFAGLAGALSFSQNRVVFDRLDGAVNGGRAQLAGEIELEKLFPAQLHIRGDLEEVPLRIPEWLPTTVNGELRVDGGWDSMALSGRLHVVRARYTENVDLERSVLEFRRRAAVGKVYDPAGEWLRFDVALAVDGDARVENDLVRGGVKGNVTLTGTLGAPGLVGSLAMTEGSRATFRGNEFALSHAVVDYTGRREIKMHLDVNGETRVREYQVFMHLSGPYDAPVVQLTSQPALTQEDLVALLSLGFTTRDAATSGSAGGVATAAAAQALFSVSGLDEQVRRFVPRGGPLRDFSVRMTSAYSEGSGQIEPRAELESKLLDERLRLRWQAPINGARGQRAQAELKLGGRASVQYQWENDNPDVAAGGDHGVDLKFRWEWNE